MRAGRGGDDDRPVNPSLALLVDLDFRDDVPADLATIIQKAMDWFAAETAGKTADAGGAGAASGSTAGGGKKGEGQKRGGFHRFSGGSYSTVTRPDPATAAVMVRFEARFTTRT